ncbi:MAG: glycoside hydrolase family 3 N-terminal domain-containing protein [Candidatus Cyclobacteriaceae bacterium M3_2C_046]
MKYIQKVLLLSIFVLALGCVRDKIEEKPITVSDRIEMERTDDVQMESFIDGLLDKMSLVDKVGQMTQVNEAFFAVNQDQTEATGGMAALIDSAKLANTIEEYQIGSFLTGGTRTAREWYQLGYYLQQVNMENSNHEIPMVFGIDHIHGTNYIEEGTIFPHEINLGATFNPEFARQTGQITAREAAALGHHWNFAPVLGVGRNKLWSRLYETFGEDTRVAEVMGAAYIEGLEQETVGPYKMAACAKHFIGYSIPNSGWDRTAVDVSMQKLYEYLAPPFQAAIDQGVKTVMINSGEINGKPVHASYFYLTNMLRDQMGFKGVALTDYQDIIKLHTEHYVSENEKESTYLAIMAGVDMSMTPTTVDFCRHLRELVEEGRIPEERLDLSVRRILRLKYQLGLFDNPYPSEDYINQVGSDQHHQASREAARESIVLMKNDFERLPLTDPGKIVLAGNNANQKMALAGGWTYTWQGNDESLYPDDWKTVYQALQDEYARAEITLADINSLFEASAQADAIIIATGEDPYAEGWGNINELDLMDDQVELIQAAQTTGKPVVLVFIEGRPRTVGELYDECDAVIFAGLPGMFGAEAIAGVISGRINPSGKMSITYPFKSGHLIPYNYKFMEYSYLNTYNPDIQRYTIGEFGTGLSYTDFEYSQLTLPDSILTGDGPFSASVTVTNTGSREGKEAVLWYISDLVGSYTRPSKELLHFEKQMLQPGESKTFTFDIIPQKHLSYPTDENELLLEDGYFVVQAGTERAKFYFKYQ